MRRNRFRGSGAGDSGERDQAREAACLGCSAREADEEDLVSRFVILTQEAIAALDAAADAEADGTDREGPLAQSRLGGDADLVVHDLGDPAGVCRKTARCSLTTLVRSAPSGVFQVPSKKHTNRFTAPSPVKTLGPA
jgi:hypothetical protein